MCPRLVATEFRLGRRSLVRGIAFPTRAAESRGPVSSGPGTIDSRSPVHRQCRGRTDILGVSVTLGSDNYIGEYASQSRVYPTETARQRSKRRRHKFIGLRRQECRLQPGRIVIYAGSDGFLNAISREFKQHSDRSRVDRRKGSCVTARGWR
jgi:hypothetical protein